MHLHLPHRMADLKHTFQIKFDFVIQLLNISLENAIVESKKFWKIYNKIMKNLKDLRKNRNLTQEDLAKELFTNNQSISNWETGLSEPDINTLIRLAKFFNVTTDYLLGLEKTDDISQIKERYYKLDKNELIEIINKQLDLLLLKEREKNER